MCSEQKCRSYIYDYCVKRHAKTEDTINVITTYEIVCVHKQIHN